MTKGCNTCYWKIDIDKEFEKLKKFYGKTEKDINDIIILRSDLTSCLDTHSYEKYCDKYLPRIIQ